MDYQLGFRLPSVYNKLHFFEDKRIAIDTFVDQNHIRCIQALSD